jgi:hypothetical protein
VYRHTGCGTCQDSRYNIIIHEYYTLRINKDTYYVSRYNIDTYYVSRYNIVKHECYITNESFQQMHQIYPLLY